MSDSTVEKSEIKIGDLIKYPFHIGFQQYDMDDILCGEVVKIPEPGIVYARRLNETKNSGAPIKDMIPVKRILEVSRV